MALTPPTVGELATFRTEPFAEGEETTQAGSMLVAATDAMWVFTGMDAYPTDERAARIMKLAIMDLTLWLMSQAEHRDEINSPFSSERIGSYSYQKMQQSQQSGDSGIYWLDLFFRLLRAPEGDYAASWVTSERVFNPLGLSYAEERALEQMGGNPHDPSEPWGFNTRVVF